MSAQLKIKASRSQPVRSVRKTQSYNINVQAPKTAVCDSRASTLRAQSRAHNSQLPVPASNMVTKTKQKATAAQASTISPSPSLGLSSTEEKLNQKGKRETRLIIEKTLMSAAPAQPSLWQWNTPQAPSKVP